MKLVNALLLFFPALLYAQSNIDVLNYHLQLNVNDTSDVIFLEEDVLIKITANCSEVILDLIEQNEDGRGMKVNTVIENNEIVKFTQQPEKLIIHTKKGIADSVLAYRIVCTGIPQDGLIIGKNLHGNRTFFGDNWPNRARHWFACVDHPSDKASVNFTVFAPSHYECIANGLLQKEVLLCQNEKMTIYRSKIPLPTKVMVIGLADFETEEIHNSANFPHTMWVYPEDSINGFYDMKVAEKPLNFFINNVASYPYEKLANVQSTTRFGGMENAGCIFYDEKAVKGDNSMEALIAHEIAHQWFGNSASEKDWRHLWLSEGFATYFTDLYWEFEHGEDAFVNRLIKERLKVVEFAKKYDHPVVDTSYSELMDLLNPNSYQKGAWVLHMLRRKIGDDFFWKGIRSYYDTYKFDNANSTDFFTVMEEISRIDLNQFHQQWLLQSGHPKLKITSTWNKNESAIIIQQTQENELFVFPLELNINYEDGTSELKMINVDGKKVQLKIPNRIESIQIDPNTNLLYEED